MLVLISITKLSGITNNRCLLQKILCKKNHNKGKRLQKNDDRVITNIFLWVKIARKADKIRGLVSTKKKNKQITVTLLT